MYNVSVILLDKKKITIFNATREHAISSALSFWTDPFINMSSPGMKPEWLTIQSTVIDPPDLKQDPPNLRYLHRSIFA